MYIYIFKDTFKFRLMLRQKKNKKTRHLSMAFTACSVILPSEEDDSYLFLPEDGDQSGVVTCPPHGRREVSRKIL